MKKFWKNWKQKQLTKHWKDTNQIGYDMQLEWTQNNLEDL